MFVILKAALEKLLKVLFDMLLEIIPWRRLLQLVVKKLLKM